MLHEEPPSLTVSLALVVRRCGTPYRLLYMTAESPSPSTLEGYTGPINLYRVGISAKVASESDAAAATLESGIFFVKVLASTEEEALGQVLRLSGPDIETTLSAPLVFNVTEPSLTKLCNWLRAAGVTIDRIDTRLALPDAPPPSRATRALQIPVADVSLEPRLRALRARYATWWEYVNEVQSLAQKPWPVVRSISHPYHLGW